MPRPKFKVPRTCDGIPVFFHPQFLGPETKISDIRTIYDDRFVEQLCREYRIENEGDVVRLWDFLKFAASVYFVERANQEKRGARPSPAALNKVETLSRKLAGILESLEPKTDAALWQADSLFSRRAYGEKAQLPKRSDLVSALNLVASEARYVTDRLPRSKGGRPYEYALSIWVANAQVFWGQSLGRKFSLDSNDGEPVSEAARFCWDLVRPLGPDVEFKSLDYTMRTAIAKTSEKENG